jgi:hypothetical protein
MAYDDDETVGYYVALKERLGATIFKKLMLFYIGGRVGATFVANVDKLCEQHTVEGFGKMLCNSLAAKLGSGELVPQLEDVVDFFMTDGVMTRKKAIEQVGKCMCDSLAAKLCSGELVPQLNRAARSRPN